MDKTTFVVIILANEMFLFDFESARRGILPVLYLGHFQAFLKM